ncbi:MAG: tetratricopeptide repeat protein [Nitrosopumilus sp.]|nr:tetratricopeptide repeat protein [Nitrosopumilus sp.]
MDPKKFWASKADSLKKEKKFEDAVKILDKVKKIKKEEKADDFWYRKAVNNYEIGDYSDARASAEKSLEKGTRKYDSFFLMGKILYKLEKYEESLECYNKASEEYGRQHLRNTSKVDQMKNVRKFEEAVKYADKVYQEKELDQEFWYHKGITLIKVRKFSEASSCFKACLETNQNNTKFQYELAKSELFAGNTQNSLDILEKACSMDSNIKEKLRIDKDFESISQEKRFRVITGLLL